MSNSQDHNPLTPWYIGLTIIVLSNLIFLYYIMTHECGIPNGIIIGLLVLLPAIYLALMYKTFKSQK